MGQHPRPHQIRPGGVVVGVGDGLGGRVQHGLQKGLAQPVRQGHVRGVGEIPLHDVGHHVHGAAGGLVGGQGAGESGVQHRELGADHVCLGAAPLEIPLLLGDDAAVRALAAGGGDGQHHTYGQRLLNFGFAGEEVPEVPAVQRAEADGLGGVDDAAAAHRQQEVHPGLPDQVDALVDLAAAGIGVDAGELGEGDARLVQGGGHGVIGAVAVDGAAAGDQQHPGTAEPAHQGAGVFLLPVAEGKQGGGVEGEIVHRKTLLSLQKFVSVDRQV